MAIARGSIGGGQACVARTGLSAYALNSFSERHEITSDRVCVCASMLIRVHM